MVAEVCSAYVMRPGEVLELFATEGLKLEAVHRTRLRVGEGLSAISPATPGPWPWPMPNPIQISPIAPRRARRSTAP
jgi:Signal transduction protein containing GAF and PtsI domains